MNKLIYNFVAGILIGTCMILPGVSGSVVAIMLGIYEEVIMLFSSEESNFYKIKKILPIALGLMIGVFIFGKVLLFFYNKYTFFMIYIFIGLILGSIPILKMEIDEHNKKINFKVLLLSLFLSVIIFLIPKIFNFEISNNPTFLNLFFGGILYISGKIIPGISSSFFLMILGLYDFLLEIITNPFSITTHAIITLFPFLLGAGVGCIVLIRLISYLLNNYLPETYSGIIGFIIGSVIAIYPGIEFSKNMVLALVLMLISYEIVNKLSKKSQKN